MQGRRLPDQTWGEEGDWRDSQPGDYMKVIRRGGQQPWWFIRDPDNHVGRLSDGHQVTEHEDGTITVSPSIYDAPDGWHGWLEHGVWRSV